MEHLNKIAKGAIHFMGSCKSLKGIQRIGRAIGTLSPVLENFDVINNVIINCSRQKKPKASNDILVVVNELVTSKCFAAQVEGRKHFAFPKPK